MLASADAFVHAGDQETFGLSVLEAMACGTPAVVRDAEGLAELADGGAASRLPAARARLRRSDRFALRRRPRRATRARPATGRSAATGACPARPARPLPAPARRPMRARRSGPRARRPAEARCSDEALAPSRENERSSASSCTTWRPRPRRPACERSPRSATSPAMPVTILAVPRYHDEPASARLRSLARRSPAPRRRARAAWLQPSRRGTPDGWLDGLRRSLYTRGEGEFWSLSAARRWRASTLGIAWFAKNGWPLVRLRRAGVAARPGRARSAGRAAVRVHRDAAPARPPARTRRR